ncbi:phospholipid/cholesterol/gamma-HCH transport system substrate-binding protein [Halopolyspora algeriensis]|uniref:Phospholipid/cholesterol/gamma-HCH transport system substrate-binding protein n=1 Tax=Halopolyspora algeriensis TaxID=1500506 RepID=A0A368VRJ4_9ACTN|nr:MCE family protein [Halopolyspora algeriensis]RCW44530.1 phospholipid/cholesterol/gamma-HCH transport system substrate-binding protein [Halopolyspora algeriensis]TQM55890.1 phospholipid/cholesterol/gamma-HCH transport system substrate-binding protein [Halopolyspora algeriensis]
MRAITGPALKMAVFATVTILLTTVLAMVILAGSSSGPMSAYSARFTDASGVQSGDEVRISGVKVGQVTSVEYEDKHALVHFDVRSERTLAGDTEASVKYLNLAGQRYLSLEASLDGQQDVLRPGETIPAERTRPALDLTELFNGFRPLFQALSPKEVNKLSFEIIKVLQGQEGTVESLLAHTASLTSTIAKKDEVIGKVIDNLNHVLGEVNARSPQLSELIASLQRMVSGFAEQRKPIGEAVSALDELTHTTEGLLEQARPPLKKDIAELRNLAQGLSDDLPKMEQDLQTLPHRLESLTRTVSYGSWFNFFLCRMSGTIGISELDIEVPILPLPPGQMPERCYES